MLETIPHILAPPLGAVAQVVNLLKVGENFIMALLTTGTVLGLLNWWLSKKRAPMEREKLMADASNTTVNTVLAALDRAEKRSIRAEQQATKAIRQVAMLKTAYDSLLRFWLGIARDWHTIRQNPDPPTAPAHAIIDVNDWDAEPEPAASTEE